MNESSGQVFLTELPSQNQWNDWRYNYLNVGKYIAISRNTGQVLYCDKNLDNVIDHVEDLFMKNNIDDKCIFYNVSYENPTKVINEFANGFYLYG